MRGKRYSDDVRQPTCKRWNIHSAEKKMTLPKFMPFNRLWSNRTNGKAITLSGLGWTLVRPSVSIHSLNKISSKKPPKQCRWVANLGN